jgi:hypothetical protein
VAALGVDPGGVALPDAEGVTPFVSVTKYADTQRFQSAVRHSVSKKESGPRRSTDMTLSSAENALFCERRNQEKRRVVRGIRASVDKQPEG